jgi:hypothetical protein
MVLCCQMTAWQRRRHYAATILFNMCCTNLSHGCAGTQWILASTQQCNSQLLRGVCGCACLSGCQVGKQTTIAKLSLTVNNTCALRMAAHGGQFHMSSLGRVFSPTHLRQYRSSQSSQTSISTGLVWQKGQTRQTSLGSGELLSVAQTTFRNGE